MGRYEEIAEGARRVLEEREGERGEMIERRDSLQAELVELEKGIEQADVEIEKLSDLADTAAAVDRDFGGTPAPPEKGKRPSDRKPKAERRPAAAKSSAAAGGSAKTNEQREEAKQKILNMLEAYAGTDDPWRSPGEVKERTGVSDWLYRGATKELEAEGKIEAKGSRKSRRIRAREPRARGARKPAAGDDDSSSAPPPPPPPPEPDPPAPEPPPPAPPEAPTDTLSALERRVLEHIDSHPNESARECAQRLGRGSPAGLAEVTAAIEELAKDGELEQAPSKDGSDVVWRRKGADPPSRPIAPVQSSGGSPGETSPKTDAERKIVEAVAAGPLDISEIAEKVNLPGATVSSIVPSLCARKVLRRGMRGVVPIFGKAS